MCTHPDLAWPIAAALRVVRSEGFDALSMRRVADVAGMSTMAAYRHVADKGELVRQTIRAAFGLWESRVYGVLDLGDPAERLERYAEVYLRFALEEPHLYDLLFIRPHDAGIHRYPDGFRERPASTMKILQDAAAELQTDPGDAERDDPTEMAIGLWALVHGLVMIHRSGRFMGEGKTFEDLYRRRVRRAINRIREGRTG